jgi:multiple sugar transport system permease protein
LFAGPALAVIALFFGLPVLAAFALSLTDFDIYALADTGNLRFVGCTTTGSCCTTRCSGRRWATRCTSSWSACRCRSRCRWRGACCCTRSWRGSSRLFRTALFAPVVTTVVAVAVIWRYLFHTRYGLVNCAWSLSASPDRLARRSALGDAAIILFAVWKNFGYNMIIFSPGCRRFPRTCTRPRASTAPALAQFRHITLPLLGPPVLVGILTMPATSSSSPSPT